MVLKGVGAGFTIIVSDLTQMQLNPPRLSESVVEIFDKGQMTNDQ
ncbi:hypothetical protein MC7420_4987 [Coleofasciculus chthonoplastes PCC 7420]|uniref:Uncharacterized protein n=1 Tax=Coleofasciculus chthonoplastes PCC 7420 TaxID=118168 RepID=B4VZ82_9CYAN|nr:hypothetical protein MC7420_4987 [Coleofasciculus chthonoplastes PCC 7420]